jgi:hypothetical protein
MGAECSTLARDNKCMQIAGRKEATFGYVSVDKMIILKWVKN